MMPTANLIERDLQCEGFKGHNLEQAKSLILQMIVKYQEMGDDFFSKYEPFGVIKRLIMKYAIKKIRVGDFAECSECHRDEMVKKIYGGKAVCADCCKEVYV